MDIVTLAAARKGSGGGASKEYVDEKVAALIDDTTAAQNKTYSSAKVEEKVAGEEITTTATGSDLTLSTSSGSLNALTVYGKSEVVDGSIKSAGEGWSTVDLGTLTWIRSDAGTMSTGDIINMKPATTMEERIQGLICARYEVSSAGTAWDILENKHIQKVGTRFGIKDLDYTDAAAFKAAMSGVILAYKEATPTNNIIAIKTDNGSGIDGAMAVFETGTPLYGVSDTVRDVMLWDGSAGTVTKICGKVRLADLNWSYSTTRIAFDCQLMDIIINNVSQLICSKYQFGGYISSAGDVTSKPKGIYRQKGNRVIFIRDTDYTTVEDFVASLGDAELVYELSTPTTTPLTASENDSIAGLRTFQPQTHAQNNAGATMTVEAYAGTANGQAVNELKQDVQSEISALQITQSDTLTLTVAGWSNNAQTIAFAHDTAKRNVIDVDPSSVEEWASCGVLATAETASGITFTCKAVPTNALNFRVTSMGVN